MRLVTRRIYRAFEELDPFSDEQCRRYVREVTRDWRYRLVSAPAVAVVFVVAGTAAFRAIAAVEWHIGLMALSRTHQAILVPVEVLLLLTGLVAPALLALVVRDIVLRRFLRRHLGRVRCPGCRYLLLGQRVEGERIRCPECGHETTLADLGLLSAEALLAPDAAGR